LAPFGWPLFKLSRESSGNPQSTRSLLLNTVPTRYLSYLDTSVRKYSVPYLPRSLDYPPSLRNLRTYCMSMILESACLASRSFRLLSSHLIIPQRQTLRPEQGWGFERPWRAIMHKTSTHFSTRAYDDHYLIFLTWSSPGLQGTGQIVISTVPLREAEN
jgi:hypothetical protein